MAISELLRPQYLVNSSTYRMRAQAQPGQNVCERLAIDVGKMAGKSHMIESMVCGHHVYKEIRCATVGEELSCIREVENYHDPFAVAVVR